ncbi:coiled-coil domain-containing protein 157 isoform X2 [Mastacembelus armatus]|uniref:coiled-coil domain-containing protein 157 isoform X2 n=1 Tax=Mastacembelus armatus TaxID=205130 RepID=UPI000E45C698|nr:coiled-coil domain-containing protein 157 isoform X2 [Mastacembelus armatus]
MSQFLGRQDCIESLRKDLIDLQGAIVDVFSRTGPVRFSSWKFPDKLSCNLDMVALLEQYDFVDGEEAFNQHSHIVLLELLIDRLLLLLQSFNSYAEQLRCSHRRELPQQKGYLSIGLVVRTYWCNLVQYADFKGIYKDCKTQTVDCNETETVSSVSPLMNSRSDCCRGCLSARTSTSRLNHIPSSPTCNSSCFPKVHSYNASCQTVESSLIPCAACHQVQSILRKTGDALVELFQSEGLPSSLQPLLAAVEDTMELGHMTAADVAQWANEQLRDMRRLAKHLQDVRATVEPLKARLAAAETERERLRSQLERAHKEFKQDVEKHQANIVQLEFSLKRAERAMKESEQRLQEEKQQLKRETLSLEESNSRLKEKVAAHQDTLQALEHEKNVLQEKVRTLQKEEETCCKLQQSLHQLESQISETQVLLEKEKAKYHSACRQQESMQAKQKSLLERVDALDKECDELKRQLGETEEKQVDLHNQMQQMSGEKEQQQVQLTQQQDLCLKLQKEKQSLEIHIDELKNSVAELKEHVQALRERERLLVFFPELSPLAQAQPQSTGDVLLDMEQQLQANNIRIKVMEQENITLRYSLQKLRERAQHNATQLPSSQQTEDGSLPSMPIEKQKNDLTQIQRSPFRAGLGYSNMEPGRKEPGGESGLESTRSEDQVSIAASTPSSLPIHLQTFHINTSATATKNRRQAHSASLLSQSRGLTQRRK